MNAVSSGVSDLRKLLCRHPKLGEFSFDDEEITGLCAAERSRSVVCEIQFLPHPVRKRETSATSGQICNGSPLSRPQVISLCGIRTTI